MDNNGSMLDTKRRCPECGREYLGSFLYCKEDGSELVMISAKQATTSSEPKHESTESLREEKPTSVVSAASSAEVVASPPQAEAGRPASRFMAALPDPDDIVGPQKAVKSPPLSRGSRIGMVLLGTGVLAGGGFFVVKGMQSIKGMQSSTPEQVAGSVPKPSVKSLQVAPVLASKSSPLPKSKPSESKDTVPKSGSPMLVGEKFPQTRERLLSKSDIASWDFASVRYAINEIYARHGYAFQNPDIRQRFQTFSWYHSKPGISMEELEKRYLSQVEFGNAKLLAERRKALEGHGE